MTRDIILGSFPHKRFLSGYVGHELQIFGTAERFLLSKGVPRGTRIHAEFSEGVLILKNKDGVNSFNL
jgi:hypothetical protein